MTTSVLPLLASGWSSTVHRDTTSGFHGHVLKVRRPRIDGFESLDDQRELDAAWTRELAALRDCLGVHRVVQMAGEVVVNGRAATRLIDIPGVTLSSELDRLKVIPVTRAMAIALEVVEALSGVHGRGWLHLDINPGNIMLGPEGCALVDFGAARPMGQSPTWTWPLGRHRFMAPEQLASLDSRLLGTTHATCRRAPGCVPPRASYDWLRALPPVRRARGLSFRVPTAPSRLVNTKWLAQDAVALGACAVAHPRIPQVLGNGS